MDTPQPSPASNQLPPNQAGEEDRFPETFNLVPISFLRCEMFSVAKSGLKRDRRDTETTKKIAFESGPLGIDIECQGPHLNQEHLLAWQAAIYLGRIHNGLSGEKFIVPANEILRLMGKDYRDHDQRKSLWKLFEDLQGTRVFLTSHRSRYVGNLLDSAARDSKTKLVGIRLNPDLAVLLDDETLNNDIMRMASLGRNHLAMWLHNYFATWSSYRTVTVHELHRLCGTSLDVRRFRYRLKQAGKSLIACERSFFTKFDVRDDDVVHVEKKSTKVKLLKPEEKAKSKGAQFNAQHDAARRAASARSKLCM